MNFLCKLGFHDFKVVSIKLAPKLNARFGWADIEGICKHCGIYAIKTKKLV